MTCDVVRLQQLRSLKSPEVPYSPLAASALLGRGLTVIGGIAVDATPTITKTDRRALGLIYKTKDMLFRWVGGSVGFGGLGESGALGRKPRQVKPNLQWIEVACSTRRRSKNLI